MKRDTIISISDQQDDEQKRKSPVYRSKQSKYFARRVRPPLIRIFDMGYVLSGSNYVSLPHYDPARLVALSGNVTTGDYLNQSNVLTLTLYGLRDDVIFAVDVENWADNYKQVDTAMTSVHSMNVYINDNLYNLTTESANWSDNGFKPDETSIESLIVSYPGINDTVLIDNITGFSKITATRDYSAAAVALTLGKRFDIYVMPIMTYVYSSVNYSETAAINHSELLDSFMTVVPREAVFDDSHPFYGYLFSGDYTEVWTMGESATIYANAYRLSDMVRYCFGFRALQRDRDASYNYSFSGLATGSFRNPAQYPAPPSVPNTAGYVHYLLASSINPGASQTAPLGRLLAVIKQNGQFYYVWAD